MKRLFLALFAAICIASVPASAQTSSNILVISPPVPDPANPGEFLPYAPPVEPNIPQVKYLKKNSYPTLQERVAGLIHGIKVDVPPEYDIYGYEIRRYMAHVQSPEIYKDSERLAAEIKNVRKAKIVFKYWQQELVREIDDTGKQIEETQASSQVRSAYKFNKGVVQAFITECAGWLDKNEEFLNFVMSIHGSFTFEGGQFVFATADDRYAFVSRYQAASQARGYINRYGPFAIMIY